MRLARSRTEIPPRFALPPFFKGGKGGVYPRSVIKGPSVLWSDLGVMNFFALVLLAVIQGVTELLPVSSSAHVIMAERLMGLDPGAPDMTFLLVMLHTGTMGAVLVYFWPRWRQLLVADPRFSFLKMVVLATAWTGVLGLGLKVVIEKLMLERIGGYAHAEVEQLFRNLPLIGLSVFAVGLVILMVEQHEASAGHTQVNG